MDKTLQEIRDAEKKAEQILVDAKKKADDMIEKAKEISKQDISRKKQDLLAFKDGELKKFKKIIENKRNEILRKNKENITKIETTAKKKQKKAVERVIASFRQHVKA